MANKSNTEVVQNTYGRRFQMIRKEAGLSEDEFAKVVFGVKARGHSVTRVEANLKQVSFNVSHKICNLFDVDMDWLVTGSAKLSGEDIVRVPGIGARIMAFRQFKGMSAFQLSKQSGLGECSTNVTRLEQRKHRPRMATVRKLAKSLNIRSTNLAFGVYL